MSPTNTRHYPSDIRRLPSIPMTVKRKRPSSARVAHKPAKYSKRPPQYLANRFKICHQIGSGSFGTIFKAWDLKCSRESVAIKVDYSSGDRDDIKDGLANAVMERVGHEAASIGSDELRHAEQLKKEADLYGRFLKDIRGFPQLYTCGHLRLSGTGPPRRFLALTLLGKNLDDLFDACGHKWSVSTRALVAIELLSRLEMFHDQTGHIHRDVKPENLMMGETGTLDDRTLHLIDLGLAKDFRWADENGPIRSGLTGTARYASVRAHQGKPMSRRDDLESAAYVLLYFSLGRLPWQGLTGPKKQRYEKILQRKQRLTSTELFAGAEPPFKLLLDHARSLPFSARPDYEMLRREFRSLLPARRLAHPVFDWNVEDDVKIVYDSKEIVIDSKENVIDSKEIIVVD